MDTLLASEARGRREIEAQRGTVLARLRTIHQRRRARPAATATPAARASPAGAKRHAPATGKPASASETPPPRIRQTRHALSALVAVGGAVPSAIGGTGVSCVTGRRSLKLALLEHVLVAEPRQEALPPAPFMPPPSAARTASPLLAPHGSPSPQRGRGSSSPAGACAGAGGVVGGPAAGASAPSPAVSDRGSGSEAEVERDVLRSVAEGMPESCFAVGDPDAVVAAPRPVEDVSEAPPLGTSPTRYVWFREGAHPVRIDATSHAPAVVAKELRREAEQKARKEKKHGLPSFAQRTQQRQAKRQLQERLARQADGSAAPFAPPSRSPSVEACHAAVAAARARPPACAPLSPSAIDIASPTSPARPYGSGLSALAAMIASPSVDSGGAALAEATPALTVLCNALDMPDEDTTARVLNFADKEPPALPPAAAPVEAAVPPPVAVPAGDAVFDAAAPSYDTVLRDCKQLDAARGAEKLRQQRLLAYLGGGADGLPSRRRNKSVMELLWGVQTGAAHAPPGGAALAADYGSAHEQPPLVQQAYAQNVALTAVDAHPQPAAPAEGKTALTWLVKAIAMGVKARTEQGPPQQQAGRSTSPQSPARRKKTRHGRESATLPPAAPLQLEPKPQAAPAENKTSSSSSSTDPSLLFGMDTATVDRMRGREKPRPKPAPPVLGDGVGGGRGPGGAPAPPGDDAARPVRHRAVRAVRSQPAIAIPKPAPLPPSPPTDALQHNTSALSGWTVASCEDRGEMVQGWGSPTPICSPEAVAVGSAANAAARARAQGDGDTRPCASTTGCTRDGCIVRARIMGRPVPEDAALAARGAPVRKTCVTKLTAAQRRALAAVGGEEPSARRRVRGASSSSASRKAAVEERERGGGGLLAARRLRAERPEKKEKEHARRRRRGRSGNAAAPAARAAPPEVVAVRGEIRRLQAVLA